MQVSVLVMCHTRELAYQIKNEYDRFSKHMDNVRTEVFFGGIPYVLPWKRGRQKRLSCVNDIAATVASLQPAVITLHVFMNLLHRP